MKTESEVRTAYWLKGLTTRLAAKELGISPTHVNRLMHRYGIPFRPIEVIKSHPLPIDMSDRQNCGYITGLLLGDAWVSRGKEVQMCSKDELFARSAARAFQMIGLRPNVWLNPRGYWMMQARSVLFARWWQEQDWESKTHMATVAPTQFVRALFESEGHIGQQHPERGVYPALRWVTSHHPTAVLFEELSPIPWYHYHPAVQEGRKMLCRLAISRRALVDEFLRTVQPCIKNSYANPVPSREHNAPGRV